MAEESLDLFPVVDVPDADHTVFSARDEVFAVWRDSAG